jgi:hypothetical protein
MLTRLLAVVLLPTCPIAVRTVCIRKEVVRLDWPADVAVAGLGSNVCGRRGVEDVDSGICVHVVNEPAGHSNATKKQQVKARRRSFGHATKEQQAATVDQCSILKAPMQGMQEGTSTAYASGLTK